MSYRLCAAVVLRMFAACLLFMLPSLAVAQTSGLVAAYGFNEGSGTTVTDVSGNNNAGTISGATWTTTGKFGGALVFNGTTARVTVSDAPSLRLTTGMTLEAWVFPTTAPTGWRAVVDKNVDGYYLMASSNQSNRPAVGGTFTVGNQNTFGPATLAVNTWTHLAATFDGTTVRLYVNGAQVASQAQTTPLAPTTGTLQIGADSYPNEYFSGRIDEVRVYNRALSQAEIQTDMNTPVGGTPSPNTAPTLSPIADQVTTEDTPTGAIAFTVGDAETAAGSLTVSGSSANTALVPNANLVFGGSGANRTLTLTPAANQNGTATITVTVSDGQVSTPTSFLVTVTAVSDAPTITALADQTTLVGTAVGPLPFTVGDVDNPPLESLTVSGSSSNQTLVPNANIVFGGSGANRTVTVTPAPPQTGVATITVTVSDGQASTPTTFHLTVNPANAVTTVTAFPNSTTILSGTLSSGSAASLTSNDNVFYAVNSTTTGTRIAAWYGAFVGVPNSLTRLLVNYTGNNSRNCTQTIAIWNWNTSAWGQLDARTVGTTKVAVNNLAPSGALADYVSGTTGSGEVRVRMQCQASANLTNRGDVMSLVYDVPSGPNTAPTLSPIADQVTTEDTPTGAIAFTVGDAETAAGSLTVSGSSANTALVPNANLVFGGSGANRTLTLTPAANQNGTATITVTVSDGQVSTPTSFLVTVTAVSDAPTITALADQTTLVGTAVGPLPFTVGDVDNPPLESLTVSGSSSNQTLVPNANIVFGGSGANRTVTVTPAPPQTGVATITVTVSDGQASTPTTFHLTVSASSSTPSGLIAAYGLNEGSGATVTDSSGNSNTGTLGSGVTWTAQGKFGSALVFNSSSGVTIPTTASLNLTAGMTLEAWVFPTVTPTGWRAVIAKNVDGYYLMASSSPNNRPAVGGTFTAGNQNTIGTATLAVNTWTHLAATFDRATVRLYVNGVQVASQAQTTQLTPTAGTLQIGADSYAGENFIGQIDEVRVYNRALSQAELQSDINTPIGGPPPPDTTPPTVAITAPVPLPGSTATVFSLVSVWATVSDNVSIAGVRFLLDGAPLGAEATWAPYAVLWDTTSVSLGDHILTAVARDLAGNMTTSAPVTVTVVTPTTSLVGQWSTPVAWPIVAVNAMLLPTGEILAWDGQGNGYDARLWNPTTGAFTAKPNNQTNMFYSGQCTLADGQALVAGGHAGGHTGLRDTNLFNPTTRTWSKVASMSAPRWYPTTTTLPDGRVLVTAGEINCSGCVAMIPEIYHPQTNAWTQLAGASLDLPYYPHMFVLPDGRVLAAATAEDLISTRVLDVNTQTWALVDPNPVDGGSAAMYLPGKVLKSGTSADPDLPIFPSAATAYVLDMTQPAPAWQETAPMAFPRTYHTLTLLPNGAVLATGGGGTTDAIGVNGAVHYAELWSPVTKTWTTMASMQKPRLYHSTALLLPDGRVVAMGGGRFNGVNEPTDQSNSETYSPPYLFKGARPTISAAPTTATYGGTIAVQTPDAARIAAVSLLRLGAATHAFDQNQRFLQLPFTTGNGALNVQTPANANLAPLGHYMLFILDTNGVPSVAAILQLQ